MFQEGCPAIAVKVTFADGKVVSTKTIVLRDEPERVAVRFSPTIPFPVLFAAQRRLKHLEQLKEQLREGKEHPA